MSTKVGRTSQRVYTSCFQLLFIPDNSIVALYVPAAVELSSLLLTIRYALSHSLIAYVP